MINTSRRAFMAKTDSVIEALKFTLTNDSQAGTISFNIPNGLTEQQLKEIEISTNGKNWMKYENHGTGLTITSPTLLAGESVYFRGVGLQTANSNTVFSNFSSSQNVKFVCEGKVSYLIKNDNVVDYGFYGLFFNCKGIVTAPELPATTLADSCYYVMFGNCINLTTAPELPATTLASFCYSNMFYGCTSLVNAPELPATTLVSNCYRRMFYGCTSLVNAPELPATTLATYCYYEMFYGGCTSLVNAPALPATTLASNCYSSMFRGCTSLTTAPELPAKTLLTYCYQNMFNGCTNLSRITMLATNISASNCLSNWVSGVAATGTFIKDPAMTTLPTGVNGIPSGWTVKDYLGPLKFTVNAGSPSGTITLTIPSGLTQQECTNIEYSLDGRTWVTFVNEGNGLTITTPTLNAGDSVYFRGQGTLISKSDSVYSRFTTSSSDFKISASGSIMSLLGDSETITTYAFYDLFLSCTSLTTAPALPATTLKSNCYENMFSGCTSLTTAPALPATTLENYCYSGMFFSCTSLNTAPDLPATTLKNKCYAAMFRSCANLSRITMLATNISASSCLSSWVVGVAATGTFIKNPAMTTPPRGTSGIPRGWTVEDYAG